MLENGGLEYLGGDDDIELFEIFYSGAFFEKYSCEMQDKGDLYKCFEWCVIII